MVNLMVVPDEVDRTVAWLSGIAGVFVLLFFLAVLVLVIAAVISALINKYTTAGGKLLWILFILWFPVFGAVAWFVVGKKGHLNRLLGIDKGRSRHTAPVSVGQHSNVQHEQQPARGQYEQGQSSGEQSGAVGAPREPSGPNIPWDRPDSGPSGERSAAAGSPYHQPDPNQGWGRAQPNPGFHGRSGLVNGPGQQPGADYA